MATGATSSSAATTTAGSNDAFLRITTQSGSAENNGNDRVGLLKFDLSGPTESIVNSAVRLEVPRGPSSGHATNIFLAGETLFLYGVPDLAADEDFDEATVTFAASPYTTGVGGATNPRDPSDLTANSVNDNLAVLLDTYTFPANSDAGDLVDFQSVALNSFLQADTNTIASFLLTVSQVNAFNTGVFGSDTGTEGTPLPPTLLTNSDAPLIGTDFNMMNGADLDDFEILRANYLTGTTFAQGDANLDGIVNHEDFFMWRTDFLMLGGNPALISFNPVPEPTAVALACPMLSGMLLRRRRR